jgi:hypothetical protein
MKSVPMVLSSTAVEKLCRTQITMKHVLVRDIIERLKEFSNAGYSIMVSTEQVEGIGSSGSKETGTLMFLHCVQPYLVLPKEKPKTHRYRVYREVDAESEIAAINKVWNGLSTDLIAVKDC